MMFVLLGAMYFVILVAFLLVASCILREDGCDD
jgi:hypothetical protein